MLEESAQADQVRGILAASWLQDKYGYRRTIQINLVLMAAFIFVVFFSPSIQVLFVGQMLCGIPWGAFSSVSSEPQVPKNLRRNLLTPSLPCRTRPRSHPPACAGT